MNINNNLPTNSNRPKSLKPTFKLRAIYYCIKNQELLILKIEDPAPLTAIYCFKTSKPFVVADFSIFLDHRNTKFNGLETRVTLKFLQQELQMFALMQAVRLLKI